MNTSNQIPFVRLAAISVATGFAALMQSCVEFDSSSVKPTAIAPESTQVDAASVDLDDSLPLYVLAVEPVQFSGAVNESYTRIEGSRETSGQIKRKSDITGEFTNNKADIKLDGKVGAKSKSSGSSSATSEIEVYTRQKSTAPDVRAIKIAAQFTSALSGVENFSLRELSAIKQTGDGKFTARLKEGEIGPFLVRALITEYNPEAELDKAKIRILPGTSFERDDRVGMVALDVSIIDGRDGSIVSSFPAYGGFKWKKKESDVGIFISGYSAEKQAKSVMENALRAALNDAAVKAFEQMRQRAS